MGIIFHSNNFLRNPIFYAQFMTEATDQDNADQVLPQFMTVSEVMAEYGATDRPNPDNVTCYDGDYYGDEGGYPNPL
ncbi:MAG: hypothetical protein HN348_18250 [Proteobacteria bacterium]|nr:hypothetical protein [Pseudomonadota bacterium]